MFEYILRAEADFFDIKYETILSGNHILTKADEQKNIKYGMYIPVKMILLSKDPLFHDGTLVISAYPRYTAFINKFYSLVKDNIFDDEALLWLNQNIKPLTLDEGYENKRNPLSYSYIYAQNDLSKLNINKIQPTTFKIEPDNTYNNLTSFKFNKWYGKDQTCYGTVINNEIVSYAALNTPEENGTATIGVGTIENERRKGYALSNTVAVAKSLVEKRNDACYYCDRHNLASQKVAKKAGFEFVAKKYFIFCEHI